MFAAQISKTDLLTFPKYAKIVGDGEGTTLPPCPEPNGTMFTTMAPTTTTTVVPPLPVCSTMAAASTEAQTQTQPQMQTSPQPPEGTTGKDGSPSTGQNSPTTVGGTSPGSLGSTTKAAPLEENLAEVSDSTASTGTERTSSEADILGGSTASSATVAEEQTTAQVQCVDPEAVASKSLEKTSKKLKSKAGKSLQKLGAPKVARAHTVSAPCNAMLCCAGASINQYCKCALAQR
ncbi:unnamed protein product [Cylicostephanus goldi]|uniref:Uncharacterized protein n=1 Tax=Cylicostephanus goldi TaxID=71465 RepID=A0A3P6R9Q1_CYLGO|nr:unnamed protein product [Cylicostephanus goldi]